MALTCVKYQLGESVTCALYPMSALDNHSCYGIKNGANLNCSFHTYTSCCGNDICIEPYNGSDLVNYVQVLKNCQRLTGSCSNACSPYCAVTLCNDTGLAMYVRMIHYGLTASCCLDDGCYYSYESAYPVMFIVNPKSQITIPQLLPNTIGGYNMWRQACCGGEGGTITPSWYCGTLAEMTYLRTLTATPLPAILTDNSCWCYYTQTKNGVTTCYCNIEGTPEPKWFGVTGTNLQILNDGDTLDITNCKAIACFYSYTTDTTKNTCYNPIFGVDERGCCLSIKEISPCYNGLTREWGKDSIMTTSTFGACRHDYISHSGGCILSGCNCCSSATWPLTNAVYLWSPCAFLNTSCATGLVSNVNYCNKGWYRLDCSEDGCDDWVKFKAMQQASYNWCAGWACDWPVAFSVTYKGYEFTDPADNCRKVTFGFVSCVEPTN